MAQGTTWTLSGRIWRRSSAASTVECVTTESALQADVSSVRRMRSLATFNSGRSSTSAWRRQPQKVQIRDTVDDPGLGLRIPRKRQIARGHRSAMQIDKGETAALALQHLLDGRVPRLKTAGDALRLERRPVARRFEGTKVTS